jgi:hypothetical protein
MRPILITYKTIRTVKTRGNEMDGLKGILAVFMLTALLLTAATPAGAQFPDMQMQSPFDMGGPWGGDQGMMGPMGSFSSPFGGMFPGMSGTVEVYRAPALEDSGKSLVATLESVPQLSLFTAAIKETGYADKLNGDGNYLVFAPPDKALKRDLGVKSVGDFLTNARLALGIVENSVVLDSKEPADRSIELSLTAVSGKPIVARKEKTGMAANGADVIKIYKATNGYVMVTDGAVGT